MVNYVHWGLSNCAWHQCLFLCFNFVIFHVFVPFFYWKSTKAKKSKTWQYVELITYTRNLLFFEMLTLSPSCVSGYWGAYGCHARQVGLAAPADPLPWDPPQVHNLQPQVDKEQGCTEQRDSLMWVIVSNEVFSKEVVSKGVVMRKNSGESGKEIVG